MPRQRLAWFVFARRHRLFIFFILVAGLTIVRLIGLHFSIVDLYIDESQYWSWSRDLAFGYFSKPPLIGWIIAASGWVCGDGEACVRAPAPFLYFGMAVGVYATARQLYNDRAAFWAGLTVILAPGVIFSARIMTTDVPLLFFWTLALLAYVKLLVGHDRRWAIFLAIAFGLGLLAKYAMVYFFFSAVVAGLVDRRARALLVDWPLWLAFIGGTLFLVPNLAWNLDNDMITMLHTGANIRGPGAGFDTIKGIEFFAAQFALAGPIVFAALIVLSARANSPFVEPNDRVMLAFSLPTLVMITALAVVSKANANWAASSLIAAFVVVPAVLVRMQRMGLVVAGLAIGLVCQVALLTTDTIANRLKLPLLNQPDVYARTMGWRALGLKTGQVATLVGARSIVAEARSDVASLLYYARQTGLPVYAWPQRGPIPTDHFQLTRPLHRSVPRPVLAVSNCPQAERFAANFSIVEPVGSFTAASGPTSSRTYYLFLLDDPVAPAAAPRRC